MMEGEQEDLGVVWLLRSAAGKEAEDW